MNYRKHYQQLIDRAKNRTTLTYSEHHYIVPTCVSDNVNRPFVYLSPEERYIAVWLLKKIYPASRGLVEFGNNVKNNKHFGVIRRRTTGKKVVKNNLVFHSIRAAAKSANVTDKTMAKWCKEEKNGWRFE